MLRILSLGAGVQSTTIALMAKHGEIPPIDCSVFADTGSEPDGVYKHLAWLETLLPFPVHHVSQGNLYEHIKEGFTKGQRIDGRPPFFTGDGGMINRQCTTEYKIFPIQKKIRELAGIKKGSRGPKDVAVHQLIGISTDEAGRMKPSNFRWMKNVFPLIDLDMSRSSCLNWMEKKGYPKPPKSACTFCPYHNANGWREMKLHDPKSFAQAVEVDRLIRPGLPGPSRPVGDAWYVHSSKTPLEDVDFQNAEDRGQTNLFGNECTGMCGN